MKPRKMIINTHFSQRAAVGCCAFMTALVGLTFFYTLWQWRTDWVSAHQAIPAPALVSIGATAEKMAAIPDEHLFGAAASDVPISSLQLRVTGIVKMNSSGNAASKAYISIAGQPSKIYRIGDSLPYGVKIQAITADTVIVENDGHLEKLPLPREKLQFKMRNEEE